MKAGHTSVTHLADLREVVERERVESGVLLTLQEPTQPMRTGAASSGWYASPWSTKHPWIQIRTLKELLARTGMDYTHPGHGDHQEGPKGEVPLSTTEGPPSLWILKSWRQRFLLRFWKCRAACQNIAI